MTFKTGLKEFGGAKFLIPSIALNVIDRAVQTHGAAVYVVIYHWPAGDHGQVVREYG